MTITQENKVLRLVREFDAPVEKLYRAFTDADVMKGWFGPEGTEVYHSEVDLRVGGAWRVGILTSSGDKRDVCGSFTRVEDRAIAYTWHWEFDGAPDDVTLVTIVFESVDDSRSKIRLTQEDFKTEGNRDDHEEGWTSSFRCLDNYIKEYS